MLRALAGLLLIVGAFGCGGGRAAQAGPTEDDLLGGDCMEIDDYVPARHPSLALPIDETPPGLARLSRELTAIADDPAWAGYFRCNRLPRAVRVESASREPDGSYGLTAKDAHGGDCSYLLSTDASGGMRRRIGIACP